MLKWMRKRLSRDEGFTLIELMVVVLIIAVLVAIAIPSFLGFRDRAQDRSAQSDVRSAVLAEKGYFTDTEEYTDDDVALKEFIPTLPVVNGAIDDDNVYAEMVSTSLVCLHRKSASGTVFSARLSGDTATGYASEPKATPVVIPDCNNAGAWNTDPTIGW